MLKRLRWLFFLTLTLNSFHAHLIAAEADSEPFDTVSLSFTRHLSDEFVARWNANSSGTEQGRDSLLSFFTNSNGGLESSALFYSDEDDIETQFCGYITPRENQEYTIHALIVYGEDGLSRKVILGVSPGAYAEGDVVMKAAALVEPVLPPNLFADGGYSGGSGTQEDPFQIATAEDLIALSLTSSHWDKHFIQTANIIFSSDYVSEDWNGDGVINASDQVGMQPIGLNSLPFSGVYNGGDFRIKHLLVDNGNNYAGMFGYCSGATLSNIGLAAVYIYGWRYVGGLVGYCYANNLIEACYVTGYVAGFRYVGGLVGYIRSSTEVTECISTSSVDGALNVGGFVGTTMGSDVLVSNSVSAGEVDGWYATGGLIGNGGSATVENVYSETEVNGLFSEGGLIGSGNNTDVVDSYWDIEASGLSSSASSNGSTDEGLSSEKLADSSTFVNWDTAIWSFDKNLNSGLPVIEVQSDFYEPVETEFVGSGSWDDPDNWTNGVPDKDEITTAIISGEVDINSPVALENLIVENGGVVNVYEGADIDVSEDMIIVSDSTGSGEFFVNTVTDLDTALLEKYFQAETWNFICLPVDVTADNLLPDLQLASSWNDPNADYWLVEYSETKRAQTGTGMSDIFDGSTVLQAGKGYMVWVERGQVGAYTHLVPSNESTVVTHLSSGQAVNNLGWNLVGNPLTYTMTYDDVFDCEHNRVHYTGAVYLWDGVGYKTWVDGIGDEEAQTVSPLEAFFVKQSDGESGYFCMTKGACDCTATEVKSAALKSERCYSEVITLMVKNKTGSDKAYLRVTGDKKDYRSAQKLELHNANRPSIFLWGEDEVEYAVAVAELDTASVMVPVELSLNDSESFALNMRVKGDDVYSYRFWDGATAYDFTKELDVVFDTGEAVNSSRFSLEIIKNVIGTETYVINNQEETDVLAKLSTDFHFLEISSMYKKALEATVYDMSGHQLRALCLQINESEFFNLPSGVYIVFIKSGRKENTVKVVIP